MRRYVYCRLRRKQSSPCRNSGCRQNTRARSSPRDFSAPSPALCSIPSEPWSATFQVIRFLEENDSSCFDCAFCIDGFEDEAIAQVLESTLPHLSGLRGERVTAGPQSHAMPAWIYGRQAVGGNVMSLNRRLLCEKVEARRVEPLS